MATAKRPKSKASRSDRRSGSASGDTNGSGDSESHVRCKICHRWYQAITYTHLRYRHGIEDPQDYKRDFAVETMASRTVRRKLSEQKLMVDRQATIYIRSNWGKVPLKEITRYLGVNASTVRSHAAKLGLGLLVEKWTESKILRLLGEAWSSGLPLSSGEARHRMSGLYKAALRTFGSWRAGLERAGIPYAQVSRRAPFEKWTRRRILEDIRALSREGKERDYRSLQAGHSKLYAAARNHFGNWARALRAAAPPNKS